MLVPVAGQIIPAQRRDQLEARPRQTRMGPVERDRSDDIGDSHGYSPTLIVRERPPGRGEPRRGKTPQPSVSIEKNVFAFGSATNKLARRRPHPTRRQPHERLAAGLPNTNPAAASAVKRTPKAPGLASSRPTDRRRQSGKSEVDCSTSKPSRANAATNSRGPKIGPRYDHHQPNRGRRMSVGRFGVCQSDSTIEQLVANGRRHDRSPRHNEPLVPTPTAPQPPPSSQGDNLESGRRRLFRTWPLAWPSVLSLRLALTLAGATPKLREHLAHHAFHVCRWLLHSSRIPNTDQRTGDVSSPIISRLRSIARDHSPFRPCRRQRIDHQDRSPRSCGRRPARPSPTATSSLPSKDLDGCGGSAHKRGRETWRHFPKMRKSSIIEQRRSRVNVSGVVAPSPSGRDGERTIPLAAESQSGHRRPILNEQGRVHRLAHLCVMLRTLFEWITACGGNRARCGGLSQLLRPRCGTYEGHERHHLVQPRRTGASRRSRQEHSTRPRPA